MIKKIITLTIILGLFPYLLSARIVDFNHLDHTVGIGLKENPDVYVLQHFLRDQGLYHGALNGNYLKETKQAVAAFQKINGLRRSGMVDRRTRNRINVLLGQALAKKLVPPPIPPLPTPSSPLPPSVTAHPLPPTTPSSPSVSQPDAIQKFSAWAASHGITLQAVSSNVDDMYYNRYDPGKNNLPLTAIQDLDVAYRALMQLPDSVLELLSGQTLYFSTAHVRPYTVIKGNYLNTLRNVHDGIIYTEPLKPHNVLHEFGHIIDYHGFQGLYDYNYPAWKTRKDEYNQLFDTSGIIYPPTQTPPGYMSSYATANKAENFAEHFAYFVNEGALFSQKAAQDTLLQKKYDFLRNNVLGSKEADGWSTVAAPVADAWTPLPPVGGLTTYSDNLTKTGAWLAANMLLDGAILYTATKINPYFSNIAAIGMTKDSTKYTQVKAWMQWYLSHLNATDVWGVGGTMYDYDILNGVETPTKTADSTDSYAATFLSLAWNYYNTGDSGAQAYVRTLSAPLDTIGGVLVKTADPADGMTWARTDYKIKYLMDNTEVYRGLRDLAALFQYAFPDPTKAAYYNSRADLILQGIQGMWKGTYYAPYKDVSGGSGTIHWDTWYPDATSQLFPVLEGVIAPSDPNSKTAYNNFNLYQSGWQTLDFNAKDPFPWVLIGGAAALMGDGSRVDTYIASIQNKYVNANFPWPWYSAEGGWFMRLNSYLSKKGW